MSLLLLHCADSSPRRSFEILKPRCLRFVNASERKIIFSTRVCSVWRQRERERPPLGLPPRMSSLQRRRRRQDGLGRIASLRFRRLAETSGGGGGGGSIKSVASHSLHCQRRPPHPPAPLLPPSDAPCRRSTVCRSRTPRASSPSPPPLRDVPEACVWGRAFGDVFWGHGFGDVR